MLRTVLKSTPLKLLSGIPLLGRAFVFPEKETSSLPSTSKCVEKKIVSEEDDEEEFTLLLEDETLSLSSSLSSSSSSSSPKELLVSEKEVDEASVVIFNPSSSTPSSQDQDSPTIPNGIHVILHENPRMNNLIVSMGKELAKRPAVQHELERLLRNPPRSLKDQLDQFPWYIGGHPHQISGPLSSSSSSENGPLFGTRERIGSIASMLGKRSKAVVHDLIFWVKSLRFFNRRKRSEEDDGNENENENDEEGGATSPMMLILSAALIIIAFALFRRL